LDFRRNTNPPHLALTSTRNWPKSLSIFPNHVKRKPLLLEIERIAGRRGVGGWTSASWGRRMTSIRLDLSSDGCSGNAPSACASLVYCTCTWPSACPSFPRQIMYKERGNAHWSAAAAQMSKLPKYCSLLTSWTAGRSTQAKCQSTIRLILLPRNH